MRENRRFLLVALLLCAFPVAARAQWASSQTEHDWCICVGGQTFGIVQKAIYTISLTTPSWRTTTIYLGPLSTSTRFEAPYVAAFALLLPAGATAILLATRLRR